jgi:DNA-binding transcriptional LysR family regulator
MDRFEVAAAEVASTPAAWTVGYCHGSEDGMMRTIRAFRAEHPDAVIRPDGLTSLLILDGLRAGHIAVGILRGPVAEPGRSRPYPGPSARRPRGRAAGPSAGGPEGGQGPGPRR